MVNIILQESIDKYGFKQHVYSVYTAPNSTGDSTPRFGSRFRRDVYSKIELHFFQVIILNMEGAL